MIVQMSKKSKIYHRDGCKHISRIAEEALTAFDTDDEKLNGCRPCKCCCNMKSIYKNIDSKQLDDLGMEAEADTEALFVKTPSYKWKVELKMSSQKMKLYLGEWDEEQQEYLWTRQTECEKTGNLQSIIQFIANEEMLAEYPVQFRKYVTKVEKYAIENQVQIEYDGTDLYVLTDIAAWKIAYGYHYDWFKLLHCPFYEKNLTMEEAKTAHYHVQLDVPREQSPYKHIQYIVKHDKAKKIEHINYRNLPTRTKKQKKYYRQAEKRAKRKSVDRVMDLFAGIEAKEGLLEVSFC